MAVTKALKPDITVLLGATGSGKNLWMERHLQARKPRRLLVWDPMRMFDSYAQRFERLALLADAMRAPAWSLAYVPANTDQRRLEEQFSLLCFLAFAAGRCTLIADEIAGVTRAGYSPPGWRTIVTQGRARGCSIIAATQRPALIDKTVLDQATRVRVGRLNGRSSQRYLADLLHLDAEQLADLKPLDWIERDMTTGQVKRERLTLPR